MVGRMKLVWEGAFDSAHSLYQYDGKCQRLHGHRWVVKVEISIDTTEYEGDGVSVDFNRLKHLIDQYDHRYLNEAVDVFSQISPSAENIIQVLADDIEMAIQGCKGNPKLKRIELYETPKNCVVLEF